MHPERREIEGLAAYRFARRPAPRARRGVHRRQPPRDDPPRRRPRGARRRRRRSPSPQAFAETGDEGAALQRELVRGGGRHAAARAERLRLHQRPRPRAAVAGPAWLRAAVARRRHHRAILQHRDQPHDGAARAADRLCDLPRQSGGRSARRRRSRRWRATRGSASSVCISRRSPTPPAFADAVRPRARRGQERRSRCGPDAPSGSRAMAQSHTASLAGAAAVAAAFLKRIGVAEVETIPELIETAKLLHVHGPARRRRDSSACPARAAKRAWSPITPNARASAWRASRPSGSRAIARDRQSARHGLESVRLPHVRLGRGRAASAHVRGSDALGSGR